MYIYICVLFIYLVPTVNIPWEKYAVNVRKKQEKKLVEKQKPNQKQKINGKTNMRLQDEKYRKNARQKTSHNKTYHTNSTAQGAGGILTLGH